MSVEYLKKIFGEDAEGNPNALTFEQFAEALGKEKDIKLYNLSDGGYVGKDKLDAKIAELAAIKAQLEDANNAIKSYKDMDIDGIKASAESWEQKYKDETAALKSKMEAQEYEYQIKSLANDYKFSSASAKKAFIADLMANKLALNDGKVMGFADFVESYKQNDPDAFVEDKPAEPEEPENKPKFSEQKAKTQKKKLTLTEMMDMANEGKDINSLF